MIGELINKHALAHNLRPDIIACVIIQESNGDTFANRFEPGFYEKYVYHKDRSQLSGWVPKLSELPNLTTEKVNRSTSWGLMQVMGDTARWLGKITAPYLTVLCDPDVGIDVGCRVLSYYLGLEGNDYFRALDRYNSGIATDINGRSYAEKVLHRVTDMEHLRFFQ